VRSSRDHGAHSRFERRAREKSFNH
jgi:hypothetical protein